MATNPRNPLLSGGGALNIPGTSPTAVNPVAGNTTSNSIINNTVPGAPGLTNSASQLTQQLLNGMPATSRSRSAAAYYGAGSGIPGADFVRNIGYDLYNKEGDAAKQQGFNNFLALVSGLTGPQLQQQSQDNQSSQFAQSLAQQKAEFADRLKQAQDQFDAQHDLELQQFGFNRDRYFSSQPAKHNRGTISSIPSGVPGAAEANYNITQRNNANPDWWN